MSYKAYFIIKHDALKYPSASNVYQSQSTSFALQFLKSHKLETMWKTLSYVYDNWVALKSLYIFFIMIKIFLYKCVDQHGLKQLYVAPINLQNLNLHCV